MSSVVDKHKWRSIVHWLTVSDVTGQVVVDVNLETVVNNFLRAFLKLAKSVKKRTLLR